VFYAYDGRIVVLFFIRVAFQQSKNQKQINISEKKNLYFFEYLCSLDQLMSQTHSTKKNWYENLFEKMKK
jgi:hypothetical protein